jgi:LysM repeat protein
LYTIKEDKHMPWITDFQRWLTESESLNNAQMVANHFKGSDWTKESLAAMIGNMRHESSINPNMYEYGYIWEDDRGFGLVQWTPRSKYWNWATARGLDERHGDSQLARIDYEVENNIQWIAVDKVEGLTFQEFRTNARGWSVEKLTEAFTWGYERPATSAGEESMPGRKAFARRAYEELDWTGTGGGSGTPPRKSAASAISLASNQYEKEGTIGNMTYYQVKKGDTLSEIAAKHNVRMDLVKRVKYADVGNASLIKVGEVLLLPGVNKSKEVKPTPAKTHKVRAGDNLSTLASKYNTTVAAIVKKNNISNANLIKIGQTLKI